MIEDGFTLHERGEGIVVAIGHPRIKLAVVGSGTLVALFESLGPQGVNIHRREVGQVNVLFNPASLCGGPTQVLSNFGDYFAAFTQDRREEAPDVRHTRPNVQTSIHTGLSELRHEAR